MGDSRSSYSLGARVELKLEALAALDGMSRTRCLESLIERAAYKAGITVTNRDVLAYEEALRQEKEKLDAERDRVGSRPRARVRARGARRRRTDDTRDLAD